MIYSKKICKWGNPQTLLDNRVSETTKRYPNFKWIMVQSKLIIKIMKKTNKIKVNNDYAEIIITRRTGEVCIFKVDIEDLPLLSRYNWVVQGNDSTMGNGKYYAIANLKVNGNHTTIKMHTLLCPSRPHEIVDHINRDTQDNRKANLRTVSTRLSSYNTNWNHGKLNIRGVYSRHLGKYYAVLSVNIGGKSKILQTKQFDVLEEASFARYVLACKCMPIIPPNTDESWKGKLNNTTMSNIYKYVTTKFKSFIIN